MRPPVKLLLPLLLLTLSALPRFTVAQEESLSLYETIQSAAKVLYVLPIDIATGKSEILFSDVDIRYDLPYSQFRPYYITLLTAELASKEEILECLDKFDSMSRKERALALVAIYVYTRNQDKPLNESVIHMFYPDRDVELGEPLNDDEIREFKRKLYHLYDDTDGCYQSPFPPSYQSWEYDFREQVALYQTIHRYEDYAVGMICDHDFTKETFRDLSIGFIYTLALLESLTDEPVTSEPAFPHAYGIGLPSDGIPDNITPRELLTRIYLKSQSNVLENASRKEAFFETLIMREYLLTEFIATRRNGYSGKGYLESESLPRDLRFGTIAKELYKSLLDGVPQRDEAIAEINRTETNPTNVQKSDSEGSFVDFLHEIASEMEMFNSPWALYVPERYSPANNPDLYVLKDNTRYEICYNLNYSVYLRFYRFCTRLNSVDAQELANAYAALDELSSKEKALLLTALTYNVLHQETDVVNRSPLIEALQNYSSNKDVIFHMQDGDRNIWEHNLRHDILNLQYILGRDNPFFNMGCPEEELIHQCANKPTGFLYTLASWELYSNLHHDVLPPPRESFVSDSTVNANQSEKSFYSPEAYRLDLQDSRWDYNLPTESREFKIDAMRHYLLTQFRYTRSGQLHNLSSGQHLGNLCVPSVTLGDIATGLLEQLQK